MARATALQHPDVAQALREYVLAVADDELILGHRHSEWTGLGPDIESDVALSSIAQEEMGHARLFYQQLLALSGQYEDHLNAAVFDRPPGAFRTGGFLGGRKAAGGGGGWVGGPGALGAAPRRGGSAGRGTARRVLCQAAAAVAGACG